VTARSACLAALVGGWPLAAGCDRAAPAPALAPAPTPRSVDAQAAPPSPPAFRVTPAMATLEPGEPGLQLLAEGAGARGGRRDWTGAVAWEAIPPGVVAVGADGYVRPIAPGRATVRAVYGADKAEVVVTVQGASAAARPWDFAADVVPLFTRHGCNTGACHGKADGQNGFHLSLFGYDPEGDYRALTRDAAGRRVSAFDPEASLLLRKSSGRTPHAGGMRFAADSEAYRALCGWIAAGAPEHRGQGHGAVAELIVEPAGARLEEPGPQQLRVIARFADGHRRDVTRLAGFRVNDDSAAAVEPTGLATLKRRAEADLIVRYQSFVVSTRLSTIINPDLKFDFATLPRRNLIDRELFRRLESLKVPPSPPATDAAFLRRVTLDLAGRQPTPEQVREFLRDPDPDKRPKLVDRLIADRDFVRFWKIKLGDLLQISGARLGNGAGHYLGWVDDSLEHNLPWDVLVRTLLTSLGDPTAREGGPVNYALDGEDARAQAELTAQRFLGLRLRCAQCHDHPFDVWTQDDYYGLAAFFAKVKRPGVGPGRMGRPEVTLDPAGQVEHLRTRRPVPPKLPGGRVVQVAGTDDPRASLAAWITGPDNPYFARAAVNWAWAQFFGKGIADPPDDLSRANPPVHPELLDALAAHFVAHHYDLRDLIRTIATSGAYGLSSATVPGNEHDTRLFTHQLPRPLTAHQMADALAQVTDVPNRFGALGIRRAVEVNDPSTPSLLLDTFGRCPRANGCSPTATPLLSLRQALLLIGGDAIESKVQNPRGYLSSLLELEPAPREVVENLYLRALCRPPTEEEASHWTRELQAAPALREAAEDLMWSLLNSREFAFNH